MNNKIRMLQIKISRGFDFKDPPKGYVDSLWRPYLRRTADIPTGENRRYLATQNNLTSWVVANLLNSTVLNDSYY